MSTEARTPNRTNGRRPEPDDLSPEARRLRETLAEVREAVYEHLRLLARIEHANDASPRAVYAPREAADALEAWAAAVRLHAPALELAARTMGVDPGDDRPADDRL